MRWWTKILEWLSNRKERKELLNNFNKSAKEAFISDEIPILLKAEVSFGNNSYRHQFSSLLYHGFRIYALSGRNLTRDELVQIGDMLSTHQVLSRTLVSLGFDTLEITNINREVVRDWRLSSLLELER